MYTMHVEYICIIQRSLFGITEILALSYFRTASKQSTKLLVALTKKFKFFFSADLDKEKRLTLFLLLHKILKKDANPCIPENTIFL